MARNLTGSVDGFPRSSTNLVPDRIRLFTTAFEATPKQRGVTWVNPHAERLVGS